MLTICQINDNNYKKKWSEHMTVHVINHSCLMCSMKDHNIEQS